MKKAKWIAAVAAVVVVAVAVVWVISDEPALASVRGVTAVEPITEENRDLAGQRAVGTAQVEDGEPAVGSFTPPESEIITDFGDYEPLWLTEVAVSGNETPELIGGNGAMCLFTQESGSGWDLREGESLSWSFEVYPYNKLSYPSLWVGYVFNGAVCGMEKVSTSEGGSFVLTAPADGEYYLCYINMTSDPVAIHEGSVEIG